MLLPNFIVLSTSSNKLSGRGLKGYGARVATYSAKNRMSQTLYFRVGVPLKKKKKKKKVTPLWTKQI